ncbi:hypothetical protein ACHRVW_09035 [Flavobacterium collinsii]|uniref:hypothetical protein n=1 Tax=Flavobacterium collinsii TaxID=1114861 RepID=UPI0022CA232E|nr:hypothetical protein [Flavobacterium collinsii]GIQ60553.1 hypothetical protein Flavo103_36890 [Flavobacterium collinsii]
MKSKLLLLYEKLLNTYYFNQNEDEETSRDYAYSTVRNMFGAIIYMLSIVILSLVTCVFKLKISLLDGPMFFITIGVFLYIYLLLTKKFLKPLFNKTELKKEKTPKEYFFAITVISTGLFCGGMYVLGRLLTIYLCE